MQKFEPVGPAWPNQEARKFIVFDFFVVYSCRFLGFGLGMEGAWNWGQSLKAPLLWIICPKIRPWTPCSIVTSIFRERFTYFKIKWKTGHLIVSKFSDLHHRKVFYKQVWRFLNAINENPYLWLGNDLLHPPPPRLDWVKLCELLFTALM